MYTDIEKRRAYDRAYYHTKVDKVRKLQLQKDRMLEIKRFVWEYLKGHPCVDCGESDPIVLEFDHISDDKEFNVGDASRLGYSLIRTQAEISKCVVRCANCHRRKTAKDFNWFCG